MGVVHKLKQEVIDFILLEKKNSPQLSCRDLANLASQRFQVVISKSSINTILKNANLSSPIGRRSSGEKKFQIPLEKKKQILNNLSSASPEFVKGSPPALLSKPVETSPSVISSDVKQKNPGKDVLPLLPDPILEINEKQKISQVENESEILKNVFNIRRVLTKKAGHSYQQLGLLFLKLAFDEFYTNFRFKDLLEKYFHYKLPADFDDLLCLAYLKFVLEKHSTNKVLKESVLERIIPLSSQFDTPARLDSLKAITLSSKAELEFCLLKSQILQEIKKVKIILKDQTVVWMDPQCAIFWSDKLRMERPAILPKAVDLISQNLISNVKPVVFNIAQNIFPLPSCWPDVLAMLQTSNSAKGMEEIFLMDGNNKVLMNFNKIPLFSRRYLIGLASSQKETLNIGTGEKWAKKEIFYHEPTDQVFYFTDIKTEKWSSRVLTLYEEETKKEKFSILTNMNEDPAQGLISCFLEYWPDLYHASSFMLADRSLFRPEEEIEPMPKPVLSKEVSLEQILLGFFAEAWKDFVKFYLPFTKNTSQTLLESYFKLNGIFFNNKAGGMWEIWVESQFPYWDELAFTLQRINENRYKFEKNKQVYLRLKEIIS